MAIFVYSIDELEGYDELGDFDSHEAAFEHASGFRDVRDAGVVWIGRKGVPPVDRFVRDIAEDVLEDVAEQACEDFGEWAEDWPEIKQEDIDKLDKKLKGIVIEFIKEHSPPRFWTADCVKKFDVPTAIEQ